MKISEAMLTDGSLSPSDQKQDSLPKAPRKQRRKRTEAEKAASRERVARDKFGLGQWDPNEPPLHGISAGAILFAIILVRRAWRTGGDFKPGRVVADVAKICELIEDQRKRLRRWVAWIKPRKWVLQEDKRSAVVSWSHTGPSKELIWTAELEAAWRQRIVAGAQAKAAKASSANVTSSQDHGEPRSSSADSGSQAKAYPSPSARAVAAAPEVEASDRLSDQTTAPGGSGQKTETSLSRMPDPPAHPCPSDPGSGGADPSTSNGIELNYPKVPYGAYVEGAYDANAFFRAVKDQSADRVRSTAAKLSKNPAAIREIFRRSNEHGRVVEYIFKQVGIPLP